MKSLTYLLCLWPLVSLGADITPCKGTVLERRLALAEAGMMADTYLSTNSQLSSFCVKYADGKYKQVSSLLKSNLECSSDKENIVYYVCELRRVPDEKKKNQETIVLESCAYSLKKKSLNCENNSVVTTYK